MRASRAVVKYRVPILILALALLIPSFFGMVNTRINYDMLDYLPDDMDTVTGQNLLMEDFGKGAFSLIVVEDMPSADIRRTAEKLRTIEHVETVVCYEDLADPTIPKALLPESIYKEFNSGDSTLMAVFFDTSTSADATMDAIREVRSAVGKQCFVTGMSALVTDLKDLCEEEEPVYVALAVVCACAAMMLLLDSWLVPFVFLASIGMSILMNLGSNWFLGEISYITKALAAVLQLAVTMDYSIFLWHSYEEECANTDDHKEAMANAITNTITSVVGSSITTVAGFVALCFMSFTLGLDLGIVMAKGVVFGVIGCVTILPSMILIFDKAVQKTRHRAAIPDLGRIAGWVVRHYKWFIAAFVVILFPALYGYTHTDVYYDLAGTLPKDLPSIVANQKLEDSFDMNATHIYLIDSSLPTKDVVEMIDEVNEVDGVKATIGLEAILGAGFPKEMLPSDLLKVVQNDG